MHAAYKKLRQLYTQGSLALSPVEEDISAQERDEIVIRLDEAYKRLTGYLGGKGKGKSPALSCQERAFCLHLALN